MSPVPAFSSAADALAAVRAGLRFVAAADVTQMSVRSQAECLQMMEQADAILTAARASVLSTFSTGQGYWDDGDYSARSWLIHKTGITPGAAVGHTAWARRTGTHPRVVAALAAEMVTESVGRMICLWTGKLPEKFQDESDELLLAAAAGGMDLAGLTAMAAEMYERSRADLPDEDPEGALEDRAVRLETTFGGAGVIHGDLTPECAAAVGAALDALSAPAGAEDDRSHEQRYHDALQEAMRWLGFCVMLDAWTTSRQTGRKPSSARASTPV